ncbi:MAG: FAD-dependent oxidoreductase [Clostridia bacterium]|nr:FAD-dependent oxidoreductase [Clostridia bacterium]
MYDIIIIGAGPAGLTAALYARRAEKKVLVIEKETFGGQITHSPKVENYPGFTVMSGNEFADKLIEQVMYQGAEIELDTVTGIKGEAGDFTVECERGSFCGKTVIIATGAKHRQLGLDRENDFTGEGVSYCAVCDGAFYKGKDVAVIGGGNSALQEAILLAKTSKSVTVVQNLPFLTGEIKLREEIEKLPNVKVILSSIVLQILGDNKFEGIKIQNTETKEETELSLDSIFVAIGQQPDNESFKDVVKLNEYGYIVSDESCIPEGSIKGIFTAGDCRTKKIRQVATAISDGATAALEACSFIG